MKLLISPSAAHTLQSLSRDDATGLLSRLSVVATSPAGHYRWLHRMIIFTDPNSPTPERTCVAVRVSHPQWYGLARLDYQARPGGVMIVDEVLSEAAERSEPDDRALLREAEAHERAMGVAAARAAHLPGDQVFRTLMSRRR